jgi:tetratricopeptide (TPR) repeat protein
MHWDGRSWTVWGNALPDVGPDLAELTSMNAAIFRQESPRSYPGSWTLVHTLVLGEPEYAKAFGAYLGELRQGAIDEPEAFAHHFDAALLARIDKTYRQRMVTENLPTQVYPLTSTLVTTIATRPMPHAEAFGLLGRLRMNTPDGRNQAIRDAEQAIASDPRSPEGYLLRATIRMRAGNTKDALVDVRKALALRPDETRLLRALGALLIKTRDAVEELDRVAKMVRAQAASPDDFNFLARYELSKKRPEPALELAKRAAREDAGCQACLETAATAALELGDVERAVRFQETAVRVTSEFDDEVPRMEATLAGYRKRLAQARAGR